MYACVCVIVCDCVMQISHSMIKGEHLPYGKVLMGGGGGRGGRKLGMHMHNLQTLPTDSDQ